MGPIILSSYELATNSDILQGTRLQTVPSGGILTFEMQCTDMSATNNAQVSIQMPNGDTPLNNTLVPGTAASAGGIIDERMNLTVSFPISQGGHCVFSVVETGSVQFTWRVTYTPA